MVEDPHQAAARAFVARVCDQTGYDYTGLARASGVSASTITRFMNNTSVRHSLSARTLFKISAATGMRLPMSLGGQGDNVSLAEGVPVDSNRDLPVLGRPAADGAGLVFADDHARTFVERPWFLMGNTNAYAIYVNGDAMEPAYHHGELCFVDPSRPPGPDQDVVVRLQDGTGFVRTLQKRTPTQMEVRHYNPQGRQAYPSSQVEAVHRIVLVMRA